MRTNYLKQLSQLEKELITMGSLCEAIITKCVSLIGKSDLDLKDIKLLEGEINQKERELENLCIRILLLQQPVAGDLKYISAALKMVTDLERIGDNAADVAETSIYIKKSDNEAAILIEKMCEAVVFMVHSALDAFVRRDKVLAKEMIEYDNRDDADGESITDLLMCAKYFERIGDHAVNVAKWAIYAGWRRSFMIIVVEDDDSIRSLELYTLKSVGFEAVGCSNAESLFKELEKKRPQLIILDIMLPDMDGVSILREIRKSMDVPVIMATAKGSEFDKVESLDLGADDYLVKPFGMMEMVSRIKAVLRRSGSGENSIVSSSGIEIDTSAHEVRVDGNLVVLTLKEYELLLFLMRRAEIVFSRDDLLVKIWGLSSLSETRTVDAHVKTLRQKLGQYGALIETVRGVGYKFHEQNDI